mgnify:CR=1 FL=1
MLIDALPDQPRGIVVPDNGSKNSPGPMDVFTPGQADDFVHKIREAWWADVMPHDAAVAFARMDVADILYAMRPGIDSHPEYTQRQRQRAAGAIELILEARDRVTPSGLPNSLNRPADIWADSIAVGAALRRESRGNVTPFRSRRANK